MTAEPGSFDDQLVREDIRLFEEHVASLTANACRLHGLTCAPNPHRRHYVDVAGEHAKARFSPMEHRAPSVHCQLIARDAAGTGWLATEWGYYAQELGVLDAYNMGVRGDPNMGRYYYQASRVQVAQISIFVGAHCGPLFRGEEEAVAAFRKVAGPMRSSIETP